jgi:hypothetical protein
VPAILTIIPDVCQVVIKALKGYVEVSKKRFIDMMSTLTNAWKCIVHNTIFFAYICITHIYMFLLSAVNSEIPFALGLVTII